MAAADRATKVPASIRENSWRSNASCIRCSDQATKATSKIRIAINISLKNVTVSTILIYATYRLGCKLPAPNLLAERVYRDSYDLTGT